MEAEFDPKLIPDIIDAYQMDTDFEDWPNELFVGKQIDTPCCGTWPLVLINSGLYAKANIKCEHKGCKEYIEAYLGSGLHAGAWCYVFNEQGEYVANLRDQVYHCEKHERGH